MRIACPIRIIYRRFRSVPRFSAFKRCSNSPPIQYYIDEQWLVVRGPHTYVMGKAFEVSHLPFSIPCLGYILFKKHPRFPALMRSSLNNAFRFVSAVKSPMSLSFCANGRIAGIYFMAYLGRLDLAGARSSLPKSAKISRFLHF